MPRPTALAPRIRVDVYLDAADRRSALHDETFWSLRERPKQLSPVWLYDARGSRLFDQITRLPEYYLTRREREILEARAEEIAALTGARTLVELGSGTSEKTRILLDALESAGTLERFAPVDVSEEMLLESAHAVAHEYESVGIHAIVADFERHLAALPSGDRRLVSFLGSTIGNLVPERRDRFLRAVGEVLGPHDALLLGVDLVKAKHRLEAAYGDPGGVTERFVRNGLTVVNRELRADFDQARFAFAPRWSSEHEWMDIGFDALESHTVSVRELEIELGFAAGERLRMEVSAKFRRNGIERELAAAGLRLDRWWTDAADDFALLLAGRQI